MKHTDKNKRPESLPVNADTIPMELRDCRNWLLWRFVWSDEKNSWSKDPFQPSGHYAKSNDRNTWNTFETVFNTYSQSKSRYDGIGFVFSEDLPYMGVDIDSCVTIVDDQFHLTDFASEAVESLLTYTELSPSLSGLHCIGKAEWGKGRKIARGTDEIEVYKAGRYFTFTGVSWQPNPLEIAEIGDAVTSIVARMDKPAETMDVGKRLEMALRNPKVESLFYGNTLQYGQDDSRADLALCSLLARFCDDDVNLLDTMFRQSKLYRPKWDAMRGTQTYGSMTLAKALANVNGYISVRERNLETENTFETRKTRRFGVDDLWEAAMEFRKSPQVGGVKTGWDTLDQFYKPAAGLLTVVTGIPSHGKSTFVDVLAYNLSQLHGWRITFASFETKPIQRHILNLCQIHLGKPTYAFVPGSATDEEMERAREAIRQWFRFIQPGENELDMQSILNFVDDDIKEFGIDGFVLDPFTELDQSRPNNMNQTEYIETILRKLQRFTSFRDIHSWLIAHPTKGRETYRDNHPTLSSINGSAHFHNKADYGIVVYRTDTNETQVIVEKVRNDITGTAGQTNFRFDRSGRRYIEIDVVRHREFYD